jgi:hypothetical protein
VNLRPAAQEGQVLHAGFGAAGAWDGEEEFFEPPQGGVNRVQNLQLRHWTFSAGVLPEDDAMCAICVCDYQPDERLSTLPCGHHYHQECVERWLYTSLSCPVCKQGVDRR